MRLVIDTNILVSALISPDGTAFQLLSDILDNRHEVIINKEIFQEYDAAKCTKSRLVTGNNRHYPVDELVTSLWELK